LLEKTGKTYSILLSTALHEGTSFDESFIEVFNEMKAIFEDRVYFLGYLSDQAVFNYLHETDYFTAFFENGLRANNTSVNTALAAGAVVISNLDEYSPDVLVNMKNIIDINQVEALPIDARMLGQISAEAVKIGSKDLGWDALISNFIHSPK
jgi:hypothetical protein